MIRWLVFIVLGVTAAVFVSHVPLAACLPVPAGMPEAPGTGGQAAGGTRFTHVDVFLDSKADAMAAYQFEFAAEGGRATVVGIEGGEHAAFAKNPPYYDAAALGKNRVILAAFSTEKELPKGRSRIARIHLMIEGPEPQFATKLVVAANAEGKKISGATLSLSEGAMP